jgi:hypothetical protein
MVAGCVGTINAVEGGLDDSLGAFRGNIPWHIPSVLTIYIEVLSLSFGTSLQGRKSTT